MTGDHETAVERTEALLDAAEDAQSFVFLIGDQHGLDCTLEAGDHESSAVHLHLLATHIRALSDAFNARPQDVTGDALRVLNEMENGDAVAISQRIDSEGGQ